jgi:hypothetical protein
LREVVELYGKAMRSVSKNSKLYHGISTPLLFGSTIASFASPTSCTTDLNVAFHFSTPQGIVLHLCRYGLDLCCFDCSWVSNYANEAEWLFMGGYQPLMIKDIILSCIPLRKNYRPHIKILNVLQSMIEGRANQEKMNFQSKSPEQWVGLFEQLIDTKL